MRSDHIVAAIGNTPLVELPSFNPKRGVRIFAKLEGNNPTGSVKDRIARAMVQRAEAEGRLSKDKVVLEATSGNTGISLAMVTSRLGYRFKAVMAENVSPERSELLRAYGAEIVYSPGDQGTNGAVKVAEFMAAEDSSYVMLYQFGNPANSDAHYETTGPEIVRDLPEVTHFVAGLGTTGTLMGVGRRLREHKADIKVIAAAPAPGERIEGLRNLEDGFIPPLLDMSRLDTRIKVGVEESFRMTAALLKKEGIFAGVSSGAVLAVALQVTRQLDKGNLACIFADGGWKYMSTRLWTRDYTAESIG